MTDLIEYLSYPPIIRAFAALLLISAAYPLVGVIIVRKNLVPLRFTLMHGAMLGSSLSLAFSSNQIATVAVINFILILLIPFLSEKSRLKQSYITNLLMVFTIGLTSAVIYKSGIPAKETSAIFWGNIYALGTADLVIIGLSSAIIIIFFTASFMKITALLFSREIACTSGINVKLFDSLLLLLTGLAVTVSIKITGALLLDSILILPAVIAVTTAKSSKDMFIHASFYGFTAAFTGFILSLVIDIPASGSVTLTSSIIFIIIIFFRRR